MLANLDIIAFEVLQMIGLHVNKRKQFVSICGTISDYQTIIYRRWVLIYMNKCSNIFRICSYLLITRPCHSSNRSILTLETNWKRTGNGDKDAGFNRAIFRCLFPDDVVEINKEIFLC